MKTTLFRVLFAIICFSVSSAQAFIHGKIDVGPTIMNIDVLESGKTIETLHMKGVKGDANFLLYEGLYVKPSILWGKGHGELTSGSLSVGYYLPITKKFKILPNVGITWSYLRTTVDIEPLMMFDLKERFRSASPFIGMELCYSITEKWTVMAIYQYAWSRTHTKIAKIVSDHSHSCGPNYSLGVDYSINKNWSVTFGVGYNIMLSKEKHGLRGYGAKLGAAYYF